jgi:uncharacterized paraquat-inducible protein A
MPFTCSKHGLTATVSGSKVECAKCASKRVEATPSASTNTGSPKLPPCSGCDVPNELTYYQLHGYKYCPRCGRQLLASA